MRTVAPPPVGTRACSEKAGVAHVPTSWTARALRVNGHGSTPPKAATRAGMVHADLPTQRPATTATEEFALHVALTAKGHVAPAGVPKDAKATDVNTPPGHVSVSDVPFGSAAFSSTRPQSAWGASIARHATSATPTAVSSVADADERL
jgi:hypothetical protein